MKIIIQPYNDKLGKLLINDLKSGKYNNFSFSVAYAKTSGVDALYDQRFLQPAETFMPQLELIRKTLPLKHYVQSFA